MGPSKNICARCGNVATLICAGCQHAPEYEKGDSYETYYCCKQCQTADRSQHVIRCKQLKDRRTLKRAAGLLQEIMYKIRTHASPLGCKSIRYDGRNVFLYLVDDRPEDVKLKFFPQELVTESFPTKGILVHAACGEALVYLYCFAKLLLSGLSIKLEELQAFTTNPKLRIFEIHPDGHMEPKIGEDYFSHSLYRVTLRNGETWAVDTTGAQFGCPEPLYPWKEHWRNFTINTYKFGFQRDYIVKWDKVLQYHERHAIARTVEKQLLAKALEKKVPALVRVYGTDLSSLLVGTDHIFQNAREGFLCKFEVLLKATMVELYTPEKTRIRLREYRHRKESLLALVHQISGDEAKAEDGPYADEYET